MLQGFGVAGASKVRDAAFGDGAGILLPQQRCQGFQPLLRRCSGGPVGRRCWQPPARAQEGAQCGAGLLHHQERAAVPPCCVEDCGHGLLRSRSGRHERRQEPSTLAAVALHLGVAAVGLHGLCHERQHTWHSSFAAALHSLQGELTVEVVIEDFGYGAQRHVHRLRGLQVQAQLVHNEGQPQHGTCRPETIPREPFAAMAAVNLQRQCTHSAAVLQALTPCRCNQRQAAQGLHRHFRSVHVLRWL
mmetsp:Transcript_36196/g.100497  ORF Transcript_36196/g.100497 Transcript_36196/m.100497 type:complete len:246 (-) Transcript_36196:536-1273(-)